MTDLICPIKAKKNRRFVIKADVLQIYRSALYITDNQCIEGRKTIPSSANFIRSIELKCGFILLNNKSTRTDLESVKIDLTAQKQKCIFEVTELDSYS